MGTVLVVAAAVVSSGCATRYEVTRVGAVTVHTITHEHANVHVVVEGDHAFAVDSGTSPMAEELERDLVALDIRPEKLAAFVLTHGHYDHAGGARHFQKKWKIPVVSGRADMPMMARGTMDPLCATDFLARSRVAFDSTQTFDPVVPDVVIDSRTSLFALTGVHAEVLPLPSHTDGSVAVVAGHAAMVGDLFRGGLVGSGVETHFYMCDLVKNRAFIHGFLAHEGREATMFFTGHFGPVTRDEVLARFEE